MARNERERRIRTDGADGLAQGLGGLDALNPNTLPQGPKPVPVSEPASASAHKSPFRGRVELRREKAGRGGKTVTTLRGSGWTQSPQRQREALFLSIKKRCACGGSVAAGGFELQGDQRDQVESLLRDAGFNVVRAGG